MLFRPSLIPYQVRSKRGTAVPRRATTNSDDEARACLFSEPSEPPWHTATLSPRPGLKTSRPCPLSVAVLFFAAFLWPVQEAPRALPTRKMIAAGIYTRSYQVDHTVAHYTFLLLLLYCSLQRLGRQHLSNNNSLGSKASCRYRRRVQRGRPLIDRRHLHNT